MGTKRRSFLPFLPFLSFPSFLSFQSFLPLETFLSFFSFLPLESFQSFLTFLSFHAGKTFLSFLSFQAFLALSVTALKRRATSPVNVGGSSLQVTFRLSRVRGHEQRPRPVDETGSCEWRSAPVFASAHCGAPQKSAKRKRDWRDARKGGETERGASNIPFLYRPSKNGRYFCGFRGIALLRAGQTYSIIRRQPGGAEHRRRCAKKV